MIDEYLQFSIYNTLYYPLRPGGPGLYLTPGEGRRPSLGVEMGIDI